MFGIIKKRLLYYYLTYYLVNINASDHKKCVSLNNQKCKIQRIPINLHPNQENQDLHYYPFADKL